MGEPTKAPQPEPPVISGYTIDCEVGGSAHHCLYRCHRLSDGDSFLLKVPRGGGTDAAEQLKRELDIGLKLAIAGIVQGQDLVLTSTGYALLLSDPGGQSLDHALSNGPLDLVVALEGGRQLADALAHLHDQGFIHRDIQPRHIFIDVATQRVALSGLGRATSVPREAADIRAWDRRDTSLAYIAPEQTGRINYLVDYRADLYALGAVLFAMLTGRSPFVADDPLDLIYAQIAQPPPSPSDLAPHVPRAVAAVVLKLMAKAPEERYQSGHGLGQDLARCLREVNATGDIALFELGQHDFPARLELPQRLYGRDPALTRLMQTFGGMPREHVQMLLVSGYAGIGKTSLLREFCQRVRLRGGYVIRGQYHDLESDTPYRGFHEAFGDLVLQLLGDAADRLNGVRAQLSAALGANAGVLVEVFPELASIIGEAPPVATVGRAEARNRLLLCMQRFLGAVTSKDQSLVLFLDDLQWIDSASLDLLERLLPTTMGSVLIVGAYRDNEVGPHHPLIHTVEKLQAQGVAIETVPLGPLGREDLLDLIVDALHTDASGAAPLADLLYTKTAGNPLFARSFLVSAHEENLIRLEPGSGWNWNLAQIGAMEATDNVIELITQRLERLPERARQTIMLAAALRASSDASFLTLASDRPIAEIEADLMVACQNGIVLKQGEAYRFVHDRVRAGAYELIPEATRPATHLRIARLLEKHAGDGDSDDRIFDLVHHLNRAAPLLEAAEREAAARFNRRAGQRAEATGAFREAVQYFRTGLTLLGAQAWTEQYAMTLALHCDAAEAARLAADFAEADRLTQLVCQHARTLLDAVPAYETRVSIAIAQLGEREGCRLAFEVLHLLDVEMNPEPQEQDARAAFLAAHHALDALAAHDQQSPMTEPTKLAAMRILTRIALAAALSNVHLYELTVCKLVELTAAYGHCTESALAYVLMGGLRCRILGDSESGYQAGIAGLTLIDHLGATAVKSLAQMIFNVAIQPWRVGPGELLVPLAEARRLGLETGDFLSATTSAFCRCLLGFWGGQDLLELRRAARDFHCEAIALGQRPVVVMFESLQAVLGELTGKSWVPSTPSPGPTRHGNGAPQVSRARHSNVYYAVTSCALWGNLIFRRHDTMLVSTLGATRDGVGTAPALVPWEFLCGLAILGGDHQSRPEEQSLRLSVVERLLQQLEQRARAAPHSYRHRASLVAAEYARALGRTKTAMTQYQRAIDAAHASGFLLEEGLANELASEFCLACGYRHVAAMYLQAATIAYGRWGARAKVSQLLERYGEFLGPGQPILSSLKGQATEDGGALEPRALELATIERTAGALAQQLDLTELLHRLLSILLHHTGAQRGTLLRVATDGLFAEASASVDTIERPVVQNRPLEACDDLPHTVVRYVSRSAERLVGGDTAQNDRFSGDAYLVRARPRSFLCVPVQHSGVLEAIIYLEHRQLPNVFGEERIAAVQLIASQAAVALKNARLLADLKQEVAQRQRVEEALRQALHETERLKERLQAENLYLQEEIKGTHDFNETIGESEAWRRVLFKVEQVAATDASVLLLGETGTGKELVARALHGRSRRKAHPLVKVNCAALPSTLIESELFGHEKGAFTGALVRKKGRFELADRGTLFLDEIGDLPLELQAKLLRVLQEGEFERLGSTQTLTVDVRIIAATNRNLAEAVRAGSFRADLFYRLNVFPIELPPLRARPGDIPLLVWYFVTKHQRKLGTRITHIPDETMEALTAYAWLGNVRELENVIERALILSPQTVLRVDEPFVTAAPPSMPASNPRRLEDLERHHIGQVLAECGQRIKGKGGAAERLGMKPSTLYTRMKKLGLSKNPRDVTRPRPTDENPEGSV